MILTQLNPISGEIADPTTITPQYYSNLERATENGAKAQPNLRSRIIMGQLMRDLEQLGQEIEDFRREGAHEVLSEQRRPMQSRVGAELMLQAKKAVSRSRTVGDGRNHGLAAGAADIAGKFAVAVSQVRFPLEIVSSFFFPLIKFYLTIKCSRLSWK
jgi:hypothetical protein